MSEINWPEAHTLEWDRSATDAKHGPSTSRRNEPRVMVRFVCTSSNGLAIPGGGWAKPGENFMLVYKSELPRVRQMLPNAEERAEKARADQEYEGLLAAHTAKLTRETSGPEYDAARKTASMTIGANPHGIYHSLRNRRHGDLSPERAYPPIDGLEVRDGDVSPPETPQSALAAQTEAQTASLVTGLREVFGPLIDSLLAAKGLTPAKQAR